MGSRAPTRVASVALALARWGLRRRRPASPQRILVRITCCSATR
jgi:hypothetical protein